MLVGVNWAVSRSRSAQGKVPIQAKGKRTGSSDNHRGVCLMAGCLPPCFSPTTATPRSEGESAVVFGYPLLPSVSCRPSPGAGPGRVAPSGPCGRVGMVAAGDSILNTGYVERLLTPRRIRSMGCIRKEKRGREFVFVVDRECNLWREG
jgi:hypothetical protein